MTEPNDINDLFDQVLDRATQKHQDAVSEETFIECRVCGEWDDHTDVCPVPAIERWQAHLDAEARAYDRQRQYDNAGRFQL